MVQVHYGEGIVNQTGPESCAVYREVCCEALTGERAGQPLSREIFLIQNADAVTYAKAKRTGALLRVLLQGQEEEIANRATKTTNLTD